MAGLPPGNLSVHMKNRFNSYLFENTLIAALGGLLFGFDTAVISGTIGALAKVYHLGSFALGFTVASALIGTIVGAVTAGRPADLFGRRATLFGIAVLYFVSAVGTALAWDWYSFLFFRFIGGIGVGGASVVSPMYIAEISPARFRGRMVAITQFNIVLGILLAFFSNFLIAQIDLGDSTWRWMFGVEALPAAVFFLLLRLTPESPRWLIARQRVEEAAHVLAKVGTDTESVEQEIHEIRASIDLEHHSLEEPFFRRAYLKPILLAVAIAMFNQLSGINALMYYAPSIFAMAGAGESSALLQTVAVGGTNLLFTMAALLIIDHFGRRRLMLVGSIGYIVSLSVTAFAFYNLGSSRLSPDDFTDLPAFASRVKERSDRVAEFLWSRLPAGTQQRLATQPSVGSLSPELQEELLAGLSEIVSESTLYDPDRFPGATLSPASTKLLKQPSNDRIRRQLNRSILHDAYPALVTDPAPARAALGILVLVSLLVFIASHAFGQGAVIWVFISEIFPNRVRARGQALGSFTHWIMAALISWTFPMIAEWSGGHTFAFYAAMMVLQLFWVLLVMPETKGVPLEQIQKKLGIK